MSIRSLYYLFLLFIKTDAQNNSGLPLYTFRRQYFPALPAKAAKKK